MRIRLRDLKAWSKTLLIYSTDSHEEYGYRFYDFNIIDKRLFSAEAMTIRFQMNFSDTSLYHCYAGRISSLKINYGERFLPILKQMLSRGYISNSIRRVLKVLKKNRIIRCVYDKECSTFVPYKYRNDAKAFLSAYQLSIVE
jgi:hypothetical protein